MYIPVSQLHVPFSLGWGNKGNERKGKENPDSGFDIKKIRDWDD